VRINPDTTFASIEEQQEDVINFHGLGTGVSIGNLNQIEDEELLRLIKQGDSLKRNTRYSLTCRDIVGSVSKLPF
jgi:alkylated DNA repair protein alkB family protein 6